MFFSLDIKNSLKHINFGASIVEWNPAGLSPLTSAISKGNLHIIQCLIENDVNSNIPDKSGFLPLHRAIMSRREEI